MGVRRLWQEGTEGARARLREGASRMAGHILGQRKGRSVIRFLGGLLTSASPEVAAIVEQATREPFLGALRGHTGAVTAVAVTPDGRCAISGSSDKTLKVWDLESGAELRTLEGHSDWVNAVAVTPDGRRAISGSADKTLRVWYLESG